jgi:hypothetical protein
MLVWSHVSCRKWGSNSEIYAMVQIIPFGRSGGSPMAAMQPDAPVKRQGMPFKLFGILLLLPAIVLLSPPILIALLIIFVIWLVIVGSMAMTIVMSDLLGAVLRLRYALRGLEQRAVATGQ